MLPFKKRSFVFTLIGGERDGFTYQIWPTGDGPDSCRLNKWKPDHTIEVHNQTLNCRNIDTTYNDGDLENKGFPKLIEFSGDKVYYQNTKQSFFLFGKQDSTWRLR